MSPPEAFVATVTAVGMVTPVGHTAPESWASIQAGLARITESAEFHYKNEKGHGVAVSCASVTGVTDGHRRFLRHYRMAVRAFAEVFRAGGITDPVLKDVAIYLCLGEPERLEVDPRIQDELVHRMCQTMDMPDLSPRTSLFTLGHAGIFHAMQSALGDLRRKLVKYAIVGAVDSFLDEATLQWLANQYRETEDGDHDQRHHSR
jgi:3-oxoacyl-[acyl-carrier-protein] synthase I